VPVEISPSEWQELRELIQSLTGRVFRIEQALGIVAAPPGMQPKPVQPAMPPPVLPPKAPTPSVAPKPVVPQVHAKATAQKTSPDLESRIGSHWLNRIGIAAVLIGVSYFLKFAFDNNWIGPAGRITIGLIAGIAVVVWSESFRSRGYKVFSYSLKAVGIGVLYLSLWAAFQVYSLFPGGVAFAAMVAVTAATAAMAVSQDAEILAAFALTGGFLTPVLLSTGQNRELALFSYVALLDVASVLLVVFKPWRRLLILSYVGTLLLYVGWYSSFYTRSQLRLTLGFATLFFAIFAVAPLVARRPEDQSGVSAAIPLFLAFVNAGAYFLEVYVMFVEISATRTAWFALALAAVYIFLSRQAQSRYSDPTVAQKLRFLHLALAIGFITIAIPIRLETHWITIGWFVEAAVLLWVADRIHSDLLNAFAILALALGVVRLLFVDDFYSTRLIFNARMATHALAIAVLAAVAWYASKRGDDTGRTAAAVSIIALNLLALIALSREVADYYAQQMSSLQARHGPWNPTAWANLRAVQITRDFAYSALWMSYGAMLMIVGFWRRSAFVRWQALVLIAATTVKVFIYDVSQLDRAFRILSFIALGALLLAISFVYQRDWLQLSSRKRAEPESQEAVQP
jgi:uncharacterized membrane protein